MKKILKFTLVMTIVITLLMSNISVFAAQILFQLSEEYRNQVSINDEATSEKITDVNNNSTDVENLGEGQNDLGKEELQDNSVDANQNADSEEQSNQPSTNSQDYEPAQINENSQDTQNSQDAQTQQDPQGTQTIDNAQTQDNDQTTDNGLNPANGFGKLYLNVDLRLPQVKQDEEESSIFTVRLKKQGTDEYLPDVPEFYKGFRDREDETKIYYTFKNIKEGAYVVEITGRGYVKFTQNVNIRANTISELNLTNGYNEDEYDALRKNQVGVLAVGDVTGDGKIVGYDLNGNTIPGTQQNDEEELIKALESKSTDSKFDLNKDGKINIIDLSYISINKNKEYIGGAVLESVDLSNAEIQASEKTKVDETHGKIADILANNDKYITLVPKDETQDISEKNAVEISLDMKENKIGETKEIIIAPSQNPENNITAGTIFVEATNGEIFEATIKNTSGITYKNMASTISTVKKATATIEPDGTISVDLDEKVAIKKITIRVTATNSNKFADIAKVEFLNGNVDRVPAQELAIPKITGYDASTGENFTVTWENMINVTGYEVRIRATVKGEEKVDVFSVDGNSITISDFFGGVKDSVPNHYYVAVQSVNGEWRSGYSAETDVFVKAVTKPGPPDNLTLKGGVKQIEASWKKMNATNSYKVFYRKYNEGEYIEVTKGITLTEPNFTIKDLEDGTKYQVYVVGVNELGDSAPSDVSVVETTNIQEAILPKYKLINVPNGKGELTSHIKSAIKKSEGFMVNSPLDTDSNGNQIVTSEGISAKGVVDNSYDTYFQVDDWDYGATYVGSNKGIQVTLTEAHKMNYFAFAQVENLGTIDKVKIWYKDMTTGKMVGPIDASQVYTQTGENGRHFTVAKLATPIETDQILMSVGRTYGYIRKITIGEIRFYDYDSLEDDINNLYADQMHTTLKDGVDYDDFNVLQKRIDTKDEVSGEYHPERDSLQKELDLAKLIYETEGLKDVIKIDTSVTKKKDSHITFSGGLNAWQPLGIVAHSNETIKVYVGNPDKQSGDTTNLTLIATQYYPEAANWYAVANKTALKVGLNTITIPKIDTIDKESGGSLYIEYTGNNDKEIYGVRVVGGENIPVLDFSKIEANDTSARLKAATDYVSKLEDTVKNLESNHNKHRSSGAAELNYDFNKQYCILGATEIVLDQMYYSVAGEQILKGLGDGTTEQKAQKLCESLKAMEDMVDLFYQHKGLNKDTAERTTNTYPTSRLNIRYHQMFVGAAMYAGGLHIGIDWGDVPTLSQGNTIKTETVNGLDGKYVSGNYFGWGISHEIGHIINESAYVHGEVTNNYFSVLSQAQDTNGSVRFQYPEVYKKVMSGKTGKAQNVFTQLGLYWQLHLAYDKGGYNFVTYDNYEEQQANLIFARMDSYARNVDLAPTVDEENGVKLKLGSNTDNNLMRLACAATKKNLLEFFEKWGMIPDDDTRAYAEQWEKETRAIYFVNDEARAYELAGKPRMTTGTKVSATREIVQTTANGETKNSNQVKLVLSNTNQNAGAMLGYEIVRTYMDNDKEITVPVAFVTVDDAEVVDGKITYVDTIQTVNNRVFTYKVTGYDKYLTATEQFVLEPIKVEHDGTIGGKEDWVVTTNLTSVEDKELSDPNSKEFDSSDGKQLVKAVSELVDGDYSRDYVGKTENKESARIEIELEESKKLVGFKYTSVAGKELKNYTVEVSKNGTDWTTVKTVTTTPIKAILKFLKIINEDANTVYFGEGDKLEIYDATYVRFTIEDDNVSIAELDLIGQTGDNVDFIKDENNKYSGYGLLKESVTLGKSDVSGKTITIPAGSIVFTGKYKGNPAFNALKLYDQNNKLVAGSEQTFFADPVPKDAKITDVSEGIWIYWLEKQIYMDEDGNQVDGPDEGTLKDNPIYQQFLHPAEGTSVRAELYRVDNAFTLEGERLTSDTYRMPVSTTLPSITISTDAKVSSAE